MLLRCLGGSRDGVNMLQALGQQEEASQMFSKALQMVKDIEGKKKNASDIAARCKSLLGFLESRQSQQ